MAAVVAAANETDQQAAGAASAVPVEGPAVPPIWTPQSRGPHLLVLLCIGTALGAAAASDNANARPRVDPQLLMAARRGDSKLLEEKLGLNDDKVEAAASEAVVVVDVAPPPPRHTPPAAADVRLASSSLPAAPLDGVTAEGDTLLHVVSECGDGLEFRRCARLIYDMEKRLLDAQNDRGDTPLHSAAAAGNAEMISCLIDLAAASGDGKTALAKAYLRVHNKCGETALHHAVRAAAAAAGNKDKINKQRLACIDQLMAADPELAAIPLPNEEAASPLYLAISLGGIDIAQHLFDKTEGELSYSGPQGRNVLHAAVPFPQALPMVLEWLNDKKLKTANMRHQEAGDHRHVAAGDLLSRLTCQRDNDNGSTPLHLAASMDGLPEACINIWSSLLVSYNHIWWYLLVLVWQPRSWWAAPAARLLLDANVSAAYQADKQGLYPIHVAASAGSLEIVKTLLERCPDCATLRDGKGRTFLHVAAEKARWEVVGYVCAENRKNARFSSILNAQDANGDTALHRAVHAEDHRVVQILIRCQEVRLDVPNNEGMRPIDVSWRRMPLKAYYAWDNRIHIRRSLLEVGAPYGESRGDLFDEKRHTIIVDPEFEGGEEKISESLTAAAQVLALFSVLITTVTFASAFTLPGGYRSAGDGGGAAGTPVLAGRGSYFFDAFVLSDALAFVCSFIATSVLLYAGVPAHSLESRFRLINAAYGLMMNSGRSLMVCFGLGLYVVLLPPAGRMIAKEIVAWMIVIGIVALTKRSEGIKSLLDNPVARSRKRPSKPEFVVNSTVDVLGRYWSFIVIFGLPAIRKWERGG